MPAPSHDAPDAAFPEGGWDLRSPAFLDAVATLRGAIAGTLEGELRDLGALCGRAALRLRLSPPAVGAAEVLIVARVLARRAIEPWEQDGVLGEEDRERVRARLAAATAALLRMVDLPGLADVAGAVRPLPEDAGPARSETELVARLAAAVEAWRAMTRGRPGREPLAPADIRIRLALQAGPRFDPDVIDALLAELRLR